MLELQQDNVLVASTAQPPPAALCMSEWQTVEWACVPPPGCTLSLMLEGPAGQTMLPPFLRPGDPAWRWRWNAQNTTGRLLLTLQAEGPGGESLRVPLEVLPAKLDQQQYEALLNDLRRVALPLVHALAHSSAGMAFAPAAAEQPPEQRVLTDYCALYERHLALLEPVVKAIARQPHTHLHTRMEHAPLEQVRDVSRLDAAALAQAVADPQRSPLQRASIESADTYENRLLKRLLDVLWQRARLLAETAARHSGQAQAIAARSQELARRLNHLRRLPFLEAVQPHTPFRGGSHVLSRDPRYRQVYRIWQELRQTPFFSAESPLFQVPVHDVPRLYEYWCAIQTARALLMLPGATLRAQQLCAPAAADLPGWSLALPSSTPLLVLDWRTARLWLRYQPRYAPPAPAQAETTAAAPVSPCSLDSHTHIPDLAIEYERPGQPCTLLVLDAKYRLDARGSLPAAALADAYTSLGSIGLPGGSRAVRRVVLLYPGTDAAEHYASGVSLFPLLPEHTAAFCRWLLASIESALWG